MQDTPPIIRFQSNESTAPSWDGELAADALLTCDSTTLQTQLVEAGQITRTWNDPLKALQWMSEEVRTQASDTRWCGFLNYDLGRLFERFPSRAVDDLHLPLIAFARGIWQPRSRDTGVPPVNGGRELLLDPDFQSSGDSGTGETPVSQMTHQIDHRISAASAEKLPSTFPRSSYVEAVAKALDYIRAGDIFQVNLSQRFSLASNLNPQQVFARMNDLGGARYGALLQFDDLALVSNSPELFLRVSPDRRVITRPIKGTRPRGAGMERELQTSSKDQAELNMIIDLERNDLGRVCAVGSVRVSAPRTIETHPTVYHGVATIEGQLRSDVGFVDLLRATFPGGSVTGAPKIRAMEIIEELEPVRRGAYCGAIGYLAADGSMQFNLAIRTMTFKNGQVYIPVGGGIVADSSPEAEYEETLVKARAMFEALRIVVVAC